MTDTTGAWSPAGIASAITIVAGIVLLVVYAMRRGLVDRELDGTDAEDLAVSEGDVPVTPAPPRRRASRSLGVAGAVLLVIGLGLGTLTALGAWGTNGPAAGGPGGAPEDCAQAWNGCPKATPIP